LTEIEFEKESENPYLSEILTSRFEAEENENKKVK
jgi:hypothetical protein